MDCNFVFTRGDRGDRSRNRSPGRSLV